MARYFFDCDDGKEFTKDEDGYQCADVSSVRRYAIEALPEMARDALPNGDYQNFRVRVRDEQDRYIFEASLTLQANWL